MTRTRMVAQYGVEGRERQGEQQHTMITELRTHYFIMECRIASVRVALEVLALH